jgi:hypothetical protein
VNRKQQLPVKSREDLGRITPTFGRTQYFFGEVVLTWKILVARLDLHFNQWYVCMFPFSQKNNINHKDDT